MFEVDNKVGRLVEIRSESILTSESASEVARVIVAVSKKLAGLVVTVADYRQVRVLPTTLTLAIRTGMRTVNPFVLRTGILLPSHDPILIAQLSRIVDASGHSSRRAFQSPPELREWLNDVLTTAERTRLEEFLR
jgi:hypothetical protein